LTREEPAPATLRGCYEKTVYVIQTATGPLGIRIGDRQPTLDALLRQLGAERGAIITAHNPRSHPTTAECNAIAHAALQARIEALGLRHLPHVSDSAPVEPDLRRPSDLGAPDLWPPEQGFFVPDLDRRTALGLALEFGQYAIVILEIGQPAELAFTSLADEPHRPGDRPISS
jgi:hypothetical protein